MVADIQDDAGAETVAAIQDKGGVAEFLHRDVTSESDWQAVVAATMASMGGVHVLVDNASISIGGSGSAITMSSVAGLKGSANLAAYNATKGGVRIFTKGVALECAQSGWPIRVNSVHPGIIDTPIWTKLNPEFQKDGSHIIDANALARAAVPTGVLGTPLDIANGRALPGQRRLAATSPAPNSSSMVASPPEGRPQRDRRFRWSPSAARQ